MAAFRSILPPDDRPLDDYGPAGRSAWLDIDWSEHRRWVTVAGRRVNLADMGSGPALLFVHGLSGSWTNWLETIPEFARDHRVLAVDLPGFGDSEMPEEPISIPGYGRFLDRLLEALGIDYAAVVGNSMGGFVGAELAIRFPARVERLVLVSAAGLSIRQVHGGRKLEAVRRAERLLTLYGGWVATRSDALSRRPRLRRALMGVVATYPGRLPPRSPPSRCAVRASLAS